ncbi:MAG: GNAT family N-acetyltransferase [Candidatus Sedimenticola sp. (ex Thyasira tokunagai)]
MDLLIRKARIKDIDEIKRISLDNHKYHYERWPEKFIHPKKYMGDMFVPKSKRIKKLIRSKKKILIVACISQNIVGILTAEIRKQKIPFQNKIFGYIFTLYVIEEQRKNGIGTALYNEAKRYFDKKGIEEIRLTVFGYNDPAIKMYVKLGFTNLMSKMTNQTYTIK